MSSSRPSRLSRLIPSRLRRIRSLSPLPPPTSDPPDSSAITAVKQTAAASTKATASADLCSQGLEIVAEGASPVVELVDAFRESCGFLLTRSLPSIVAIHGLNGNRKKTWTANNGTHWLRDLLPHDIPNARIFCWGYDARTHASSGISCQYLYDHARSLISELCRKRKLSEVSTVSSFLKLSNGWLIGRNSRWNAQSSLLRIA